MSPREAARGLREQYEKSTGRDGLGGLEGIAALWIERAVTAEREAIAQIDMPARPAHYTDEMWQVFEVGWIAHVAAVRARQNP